MLDVKFKSSLCYISRILNDWYALQKNVQDQSLILRWRLFWQTEACFLAWSARIKSNILSIRGLKLTPNKMHGCSFPYLLLMAVGKKGRKSLERMGSLFSVMQTWTLKWYTMLSKYLDKQRFIYIQKCYRIYISFEFQASVILWELDIILIALIPKGKSVPSPY